MTGVRKQCPRRCIFGRVISFCQRKLLAKTVNRAKYTSVQTASDGVRRQKTILHVDQSRQRPFAKRCTGSVLVCPGVGIEVSKGLGASVACGVSRAAKCPKTTCNFLLMLMLLLVYIFKSRFRLMHS